MTPAEKDAARECLTWQVLGAKTLPKVLAAQQALREWIKTYPEEREWMRDGFEQLSLMQDIAEEQEAEQHQQTEKSAHDKARECLLDQVLGATTLEEIAAAWKALREWMSAYPEEEGMRHGFEQLSLMEDAAHEQEAMRRQQSEKAA